jgi:hypothetical protein
LPEGFRYEADFLAPSDEARLSPVKPSIRPSSKRQSEASPSITRSMRGESVSDGVARMRGSSVRKNRCPCRTAMPRSNRKARNLVDDAGTLADQPLPHPAQGLQVELIGRLRRHELHRRPLHRFGNCLRVTEVVLLALGIRPHVLRRHQPGVVAKRFKPTTEMMRPDAGLHTDQARRHVREPGFNLATRPLLPQDNRAALVLTDNSMPITASALLGFSDMTCSLSSAPLASFERWRGRSTAGPSH